MMPTRRATLASLIGSSVALSLTSAVGAQEQPVVETAPEEPPTQIEAGRDRFEHMLAPVGINGQGPFQFLLDTGANVSCVSRALADKLDLTPGKPAKVHTMVGVRTRPSVMINHLAVGSRNRTTVNAPSLPLLAGTIDGILGVDWLKGQRLVLGFKSKTVEITQSKPERPLDGQVVVPARRRMGQLTIVDADLNGKRISAMIDSGSQLTICNKPLRDMVIAGEARRNMNSEHQTIGMETIAGEAFSGELMYLPFLRLGGLHLGNVPVVYADMHVFDIWDLQKTPAVVLGMDVLRQFDAVSLDYGRSQVRFDIAADQPVLGVGPAIG